MWFSKNKWKTKLSDQVDRILTQNIKIELDELVALVGAPSITDLILEISTYIMAGQIEINYVVYDVDDNIVGEFKSIVEAPHSYSITDFCVVYSKA